MKKALLTFLLTFLTVFSSQADDSCYEVKLREGECLDKFNEYLKTIGIQSGGDPGINSDKEYESYKKFLYFALSIADRSRSKSR